MPEEINQYQPSPKKKNKALTVVVVIVVLFLISMSAILVRILTNTNSTPKSIALLNSPVIEGVSSTDDPYIGNPQADVVIVEFGDFQCPYCKQASSAIRRLVNEYGDKVLYIYRDFPLINEHPEAQITAEAAMCIWEQDHNSFWSFHDRVFANQSQLSADNITNWAVQSGIDQVLFAQCLEQEKYREEVLADYNDGTNAGVLGTPTFFLNGRKIEGPQTLEDWKSYVEQFL